MRDRLEAARQVLRVRYWQHLINEMLKQPGRFRVPIHCAFGHEAIAVATTLAIRPGEDRLVLTHRNMAYNFAHAGAFEPVAREYEQGRLGSMNLANPERGLVYTSSILGNNLPVACGMALASGRRVFVLTGDGAIEEGAFWESLVFARSHSLNVIFVVENNNHSLATTIAERRCTIDLGGIATAVGVPFSRLESNDPIEYAEALDTTGPRVIEVMVATLCNHAGATPGWATDPRSIDLACGLEIEASPRDPVHVARLLLEEEEYAAVSRSLVALAATLLNRARKQAATENQCQPT